MIETPDISTLEPSAAEWDARRDRLGRELRGRAAGRRWRRRIRRLALAVALLAGTAAGAVAASGLLSADDVIVDNVACLRTPGQDLGDATWVPTQPDPVAACADLWVRGPVGEGGAPPLVACGGRDETVRVMPADSDAICGRLGLEPLGPEYEAFARAQAEAQAVAGSVTTARGGCPATAAPLFESMRDALAAAGLDDWRVIPPANPEPVQPTCRAHADARTRTVTIHHITPANRIYSHILGQEIGSRDETITVDYEGRTDCPRAAPLLRSLRAELGAKADAPLTMAPLHEWRVVASDSVGTGESCRALVDGPTRTITLDVSQHAGS
jgi:hypothetical protein